MTDSIQIQDWMNSGLPHDKHSTQNAIFIHNTHHWPFIIDPQQQAFKWIKGMEKGKILKVLKANDPKLITYLENSIRIGEVVVIQVLSIYLFIFFFYFFFFYFFFFLFFFLFLPIFSFIVNSTMLKICM